MIHQKCLGGFPEFGRQVSNTGSSTNVTSATNASARGKLTKRRDLSMDAQTMGAVNIKLKPANNAKAAIVDLS